MTPPNREGSKSACIQIVSDWLRSNRKEIKVIGNAADQECGHWLNNRIENSYSHPGKEKRRWLFSQGHQNFIKVSLHPRFNHNRCSVYEQNCSDALTEWRQSTTWTLHNMVSTICQFYFNSAISSHTGAPVRASANIHWAWIRRIIQGGLISKFGFVSKFSSGFQLSAWEKLRYESVTA